MSADLRAAVEALADEWERDEAYSCARPGECIRCTTFQRVVIRLRALLAEHLATSEGHHPNCFQSTGVPDDLPADLCDCHILRYIDAEKAEREIADRERRAEARGAARALREAAKDLPGFDGIRTHGDAADWLRDRADRIEGGDQ